MDYIGKICDGCREPLEKEDDIVVCPECGTPQHRSCYEKNNRCVNEYLHSPDFVWTEPEQEKTEKKEQTFAEQTNPAEEPQKDYTGPFKPASPQDMENVFMRGVLYDPKEDIGGATVGEAADYIQSSTARYVSKLMKMKKKNTKLSWNWAAFFFAPFWFFYRKLYKAGVVFLTLSIALTIAVYPQVEKFNDKLQPLMESFSQKYSENPELDDEEATALIDNIQEAIEEVSPQLPLLLILQTLVPNVIAAIFANYILKRKMLKVISLSHESAGEANSVKYTIMRNGGVSVFMPIIAIVIETYLPSLLLEIAYKI